MQAPARLPASEADLAEWSVYVDWLLERGERRGELLARELALPSAPEPESLQAWLALARRPYHEPRAMPIAWCLGHARTLEIVPPRRYMIHPAAPPDSAISNARAFLQAAPGSRLEALRVLIEPDDLRPWRRLFAVLPASCRRVTLGLTAWPDERAAAEIVGMLPASVRELELRPERWAAASAPLLAAFVDDRFELVGIGDVGIDAALGGQLAAALARSHAVRLRVSRFEAAPLPWERCVLGRPGDAALLEPDRRRGLLLPRWSLLALQRRFGPVPVRAQLAARLPEGYELSVHGGFILTRSSSCPKLVRRGEVWTLRGSDKTPVWCNGARVPHSQILPIHEGDRIRIGPAEYVLFTRDPTAAVRAWR